MKSKIYIAGKVSGEVYPECYAKFKATQTKIEKAGFTAINPLDVVDDENANWHGAMKLCLKALLDCDAILFLPDFTESKGAKVEYQLANALSMKRFYNCDTLIKSLTYHDKH